MDVRMWAICAAPFPTDEHKAARHIQGNMSTANTNKEVPPWNGQ